MTEKSLIMCSCTFYRLVFILYGIYHEIIYILNRHDIVIPRGPHIHTKEKHIRNAR